jgi:hypothetical protein
MTSGGDDSEAESFFIGGVGGGGSEADYSGAHSFICGGGEGPPSLTRGLGRVTTVSLAVAAACDDDHDARAVGVRRGTTPTHTHS